MTKKRFKLYLKVKIILIILSLFFLLSSFVSESIININSDLNYQNKLNNKIWQNVISVFNDKPIDKELIINFIKPSYLKNRIKFSPKKVFVKSKSYTNIFFAFNLTNLTPELHEAYFNLSNFIVKLKYKAPGKPHYIINKNISLSYDNNLYLHIKLNNIGNQIALLKIKIKPNYLKKDIQYNEFYLMPNQTKQIDFMFDIININKTIYFDIIIKDLKHNKLFSKRVYINKKYYSETLTDKYAEFNINLLNKNKKSKKYRIEYLIYDYKHKLIEKNNLTQGIIQSSSTKNISFKKELKKNSEIVIKTYYNNKLESIVIKDFRLIKKKNNHWFIVFIFLIIGIISKLLLVIFKNIKTLKNQKKIRFIDSEKVDSKEFLDLVQKIDALKQEYKELDYKLNRIIKKSIYVLENYKYIK